MRDVSDSTPDQDSGPSKRIALFTGNYNHVADGVSLTLNRLVDYLEKQNIPVLVFGPSVADPPMQHAGRLVVVKSIDMPGRPEYQISLGFSRSARAELEAFAPTIIHIATPDLLGRKALQIARRKKWPVVASYHTHFSSYLKFYRLGIFERFVWIYLRRFYRHCKQLYVPSPSMAEVLRRHGIVEGVKIWERGVDTKRFNPDRRSLSWRRQRGIKDEDMVVAFVSRLVWEKRLDLFVDVIQRLQAEGIAHRSLIVGDGPIRTELAQRLPDTLFTGHLEGDDLPRAYASSDIFLFPSDTETFGNVTLEAMASGLPAVCSDATGSRSLVRHGETGFLAPPEASEQFYIYTKKLLIEASLREKMAQAAINRAAHFEWEAVLERMVAFYDEVLSGS